jgi:hypothetical protein
MRRATLFMGAAMVLWATAASAQDRPDFSGKWTLDTEKTQAANPGMPAGGGGRGGGGGGSGGGRGFGGMMGPFTLTLDGETLTRESEGPQGPIKLVYKLDGSEQSIAMGPMQATAKAKRDGKTIVIETTRQGQQGAVTSKAVYSLEGDYLVIENTGPGRGGQVTTRKMYYKKN